MSIVQDVRTRRRHRGLTPWQLVQKIGRLEREADTRDCQLIGLSTENTELLDELNQLRDDFDRAAIDYSAALEDLRTLRQENARLRADLANRRAITVPPMERDTSAIEDQATAPAGVDVKPLWAALSPEVTQPLRTVREVVT